MNLLIWQKGMELAKLNYAATNLFPKQELYGLVSQMNRCAVSIPSNIAEGSQRTSDKEFSQFILYAKGSLAELQTQTILSGNLGFIKKESFEILIGKIEELDKMTWSFYRKLTLAKKLIANRSPLAAI